MIYLKKGQPMFENSAMVVYDPTGYYDDGTSVVCAPVFAPEEPACRYEAKYIAYGGIVYSVTNEDELLKQIMAIDPNTLFGKDSKQVAIDKAVEGIVAQDSSIITEEETTPKETEEEVDEEETVLDDTPTITPPEEIFPIDTSTTTPPFIDIPTSNTTTTPPTITPPEDIFPIDTSTTTPPIIEEIPPVDPTTIIDETTNSTSTLTQ